MTHSRTLPILLGASLVMAAAVSGADTPSVDARDREVLETVLKDVMDPRNPEYRERDRPLPRGLLVLHRWIGSGGGLEDEVPRRKTFPRDLVRSWKRRNSGEPIHATRLGVRDRMVKIDDVDAIYDNASGADKAFVESFYEKYPGSWGYVRATLPGYSRDGMTALVMLDQGPHGHPAWWVFQLVRFQGRWNIGWRHLNLHE